MMNIIAGRSCPPVTCQRKGPAFKWHDGTEWKQGDRLPLIIVTACPPCEQRRFTRHAENREVA